VPATDVTSATAAAGARTGDRSRLVLASAVMLFAELALIRWVSSYQVHVAYFTNFVLLASFLGIGVGFLRSGRARDGFRWAPASFAAFTGLVFVVRVVKGFGDAPGLQSSFGWPAPPIWIVLPVLFLGAAWVMANVAEGVARRFERFEPLEAYRLDISGSLLGIVVFSALSFAGLGPIVWGALLAIAFLGLTPAGGYVGRWAAVAAVAVVLALGSFAPHDVWSPYYRVTVYDADAAGRIPVRVNSLPHQAMLPLDAIRGAFYAEPYTHLNGPAGNVLIVGAGNGNDVALALDEGATHVDAVEIDPRLQRAGSELHPARPYQDPRVTPHIDDGRAFIERTDQTYDLILFALPDSLTLVSGQGSLRLESYLFTREAMQAVRDRLAPGGVYAMYNYYRPDVFERYANTMREVFGHEPCFDAGAPGAGDRAQSVLTIGREEGVAARRPAEGLRELARDLGQDVERLHLLRMHEVANLGERLGTDHRADRHGIVGVEHLLRLEPREERVDLCLARELDRLHGVGQDEAVHADHHGKRDLLGELERLQVQVDRLLVRLGVELDPAAVTLRHRVGVVVPDVDGRADRPVRDGHHDRQAEAGRVEERLGHVQDPLAGGRRVGARSGGGRADRRRQRAELGLDHQVLAGLELSGSHEVR
jgi:SAM-dependent methyltransferase